MKWLVVLALVGAAAAFHPYVNMRSEQIDSDEHGVAPGRSQTSCKCGWANRATARIVNGVEAEVNQFPWVAGLMHRSSSYRSPFIFCGGTIITEYHVITAAHCTFGESASRLAVILGEHSVLSTSETDATVIINVRNLKNHENYDDTTTAHDIALLTLESKISYTNKVGPACLPNARNQFDLVHKYIKVMGWGDTQNKGPQSKWLRHVNLRVIPLDVCKAAYRRSIDLIRPAQLCTYSKNKDSCQGDSGGPVVYNDPATNRYHLVGLVSFGSDCASQFPGVNTEVAAYLDWINSNIAATNSRGQTCKRV